MLALLLIAIAAPQPDSISYGELRSLVQAEGGCGVVLFYENDQQRLLCRAWLSYMDQKGYTFTRTPALVDCSRFDKASRAYWLITPDSLPFAAVMRREDSKVVGGGRLPLPVKIDEYARWKSHQNKRHSTPNALLEQVAAMRAGEIFEGYKGKKFTKSQLIRMYESQAATRTKQCQACGCVRVRK